MAFLYEKSALWRALVEATRDPKKLAAFTVISTGIFGAIAYGTQSVTDRAAAVKESEVRDRMRRDIEATRYANHSKRALEVVLAQAAGRPPPQHAHPMKMPAVAWHPGAVRREQATASAAAAAIEAAEKDATPPTAEKDSPPAKQT